MARYRHIGLSPRLLTVDLESQLVPDTIAISEDAKPHFTVITDSISRSRDAIASVFGKVLSVLKSTVSLLSSTNNQ